MTGMGGIEIIVRDCSLERIEEWIAGVAGPLHGPTEAGSVLVYETSLGTTILAPGMANGIGVWFNAVRLPWASDADCARQATRELGCVVWCDPGNEYPNVPPLSSVMLEVDEKGERLFNLP